MVSVGEVLRDSGTLPKTIDVGLHVMVRFNQYMRPHGDMRTQYAPVDIAHVEKVRRIFSEGYVFECEVLTTDHVSMTITHPEAGDIACVVCANDPTVTTKLNEMVERFDFDFAADQVRRMLSDDESDDIDDTDDISED